MVISHLHQTPLLSYLSQRIRATVNTQEQKRLLMDLDISMRTVDCFYTVTFYGALFREVLSRWMAAAPGAHAVLQMALLCPKPPLLSLAQLGCLRCYHDLKSKACLLQGLFPASMADAQACCPQPGQTLG